VNTVGGMVTTVVKLVGGMVKTVVVLSVGSKLKASQPALGGHCQPLRWEPGSLVTLGPTTKEGAKARKRRKAGRR